MNNQFLNVQNGEIKIDRSFVANMLENIDGDIIVHSTIELAHNLDLKIVADGVYNKQTWKRLKVLNCDIAQGHHICKALSANEFLVWLMNNKWNNEWGEAKIA